MKKVYGFLIVAIISLSLIICYPSKIYAVTYGDANGDGLVTMADVTWVEREILQLNPLTPGADANQDGMVSMADVTRIERCILGLDVTIIKDSLDIYFIDVGEGDSILLDCGSTEVLIDGGEKNPGVVSFIQQYVQGQIEDVIATHMDADHIGGLTAVVNSFNISTIWTNGDTANTQTYANFMTAVNASNATKQVARRGNIISAGPLSFSVLSPVTLSSNSNNNSIVLNLAYGGVSFQLEGDAEQTIESSMLSAGLIHHADILKVGHHGSSTSSSPSFLAALTPDAAIYMCGVNNQYGFPAVQTITALTDIEAAIYGTDVNGTIEVSTDGKIYTIKKSK